MQNAGNRCKFFRKSSKKYQLFIQRKSICQRAGREGRRKKIALDFSHGIGIINANTRGFGLLLSGRKNNMEITKETTMGEMLEYDMGIAYVLMQAGMHCVGCPSSIGESLEEACAVHGLDVDVVLSSIQEYLQGRG